MNHSLDFIEYAQERLDIASGCYKCGNYTDELYNLKIAIQEIEAAIRKVEYEKNIQDILG